MVLNRPMTHAALAPMADFQERLNQLRLGQLSATDLSQWALGQAALKEALPSRYNLVLHDLLNRLEAGAMFSEESCSFSQKAIIENLQLWTNKAMEYIANS